MSTLTAIAPTQPPPVERTTSISEGDPVEIEPSRFYRLTVEQYEDAARLGIFDRDRRVELIEGLLVSKMANDPLHATVTELVAELLRAAAPAGYCVRSEKPIALTRSEPEPDVTVLRGTLRDYVDRHPSPPDIALLVEVANSSIKIDRGLKLRVYATAGLSAYWVIDVQRRVIEIYYRGNTETLVLATTKRTGEKIEWVIDGKIAATLEVDRVLP